ncbi:MAG: hypothetical protein BJ554DRAFT_4220 [Olpidium bornovanus]|uniref:Uncharacterized protein n=1 Tax=Olpidium bornovanus TaxID=278681 RepID=A0A8H8DLE2_9FUNG|nr:MAG: hypothetical protein BJ554DRAFT_4220 [Olpidium bornovanus]
MSNKTGPKKSQAHRNSFAYSAALHSAAQKKIAALPASGLLCARCADIVRWRKQFGKYRPLSAPKKCVACQRKAVRDAYHVLCDACAAGARCAKCRAPAPLAAEVRRATDGGAAVVVSPSATAGKAEDAAAAKLRQARLLAACTERQRRSYRRKLDRGDPAEIARAAAAAAAAAAATRRRRTTRRRTTARRRTTVPTRNPVPNAEREWRRPSGGDGGREVERGGERARESERERERERERESKRVAAGFFFFLEEACRRIPSSFTALFFF